MSCCRQRQYHPSGMPSSKRRQMEEFQHASDLRARVIQEMKENPEALWHSKRLLGFKCYRILKGF